MLGVGVAFLALTMRNLTRPDTQEISFQHFKTQLLAKDVVDRIEVANKTTAKVCHLRRCCGLISWDCCHVCFVCQFLTPVLLSIVGRITSSLLSLLMSMLLWNICLHYVLCSLVCTSHYTTPVCKGKRDVV